MKFKTSEDVIKAFNEVSGIYGDNPEYQRLKNTLEALGAHKNHFSQGDEEIFDATVNKMEKLLKEQELTSVLLSGPCNINENQAAQKIATELGFEKLIDYFRIDLSKKNTQYLAQKGFKLPAPRRKS